MLDSRVGKIRPCSVRVANEHNVTNDPQVPLRIEQTRSRPWRRKTTVIAALSVAAILAHLALRFGFRASPATAQIPLLVTPAIGGVPSL